jgi:nucleoside-diphosphate-sugar epimerase
MEVLVAGGHGKIGLRLLRLLAEQGDRARGMIRDERQVADLEAVGAHAVVCDLESDDPTPHMGTADAVVFAAGAGPGSGEARKRTMDYGGAVKLVRALQTLGAPRRYLVVSSIGADDPSSSGEAMRPYLQAKATRTPPSRRPDSTTPSCARAGSRTPRAPASSTSRPRWGAAAG